MSHGIKLLSDKAAVEVVPTVTTCALITAVGSGFWQSPELVPMIREVVSEPILLDVKNNAATIAVPSGQCERVLNALHHKLLAKS